MNKFIVMQSFLNILINCSLYLFNLALEIKYKIKKFILRRNNGVDTVIEDIYLIDLNTNKVVEVNHKHVKNLNDNIRFSNYVILNKILTSLNKNDSYILEIKYKKHHKNYIFNFQVKNNNDIIYFPIYNINELKHKNMNKISDINGPYEYVDLLTMYGGPLNDYYNSKGLGIPLKNIYDKENECFPFRNSNFKLEDIFLNEYQIGPDGDHKPDDLFILKNTLDNSKINTDITKEQYILSTYKKFDTKNIFWGIVNWIFGKQKNL